MSADKVKSSLENSIGNYLSTPLNKKRCAISNNNNMSFHWADYGLTCNIYKDMLRNDNKFQSYHGALLANLEKLKTIPLWIKTLDGISTMSLYDVYDSLVTKGKLSRFYVNSSGKLVMSFHGPRGPFEVLSPADCVNHERYTELVFTHLLDGRIPTRDFRVRCSGKVLCYYEVCFNKVTNLEVEQVTTDGILFSTQDNDLRDKLATSKEIKLLLNLDIFHQTLRQSFNDLRNAFSDYKFNLFFTRDAKHSYHVVPKFLSFYQGHDHDISGTTYIFVHFHHFKGNDDMVENVLKEFTVQLRSQIKDEILKAS